ncbi:MAG: radical SAM family heme chaperone HemW [Pseudomonadota bacterium]
MTQPFGPDYGFGLYIHWPYCAKICPYCDFNVYAAKDRDPAPLVAAICADIAAHKDVIPAHPRLQTVFFGGGTPSLLTGGQMEEILAVADQMFGVSADAEITLEANPNDILKRDVEGWKTAGINRLSVGVQSLDDAALSFLGRDHGAQSARQAVAKVADLFENFSIDMIYARPGQGLREWKSELTAALELGAPHLSLYELTIEERTAFGHRAARGELKPMPGDDQADLHELTQDITRSRGFHSYEISNHATAEAFESRHNHIYWASGDWIGVGPGAHGRLTVSGARAATVTHRKPSDYVSANGDNHWQSQDMLEALPSARELLSMGLRTSRGVDIARLEALGHSIPAEALSEALEQGWVERHDNRIWLTEPGRLLADGVTSRLSP